MQMTARCRKAQRGKRSKRKVILAIMRRLRDESILFYFDLIQFTKRTYKPACETGVRFDYEVVRE